MANLHIHKLIALHQLSVFEEAGLQTFAIRGPNRFWKIHRLKRTFGERFIVLWIFGARGIGLGTQWEWEWEWASEWELEWEWASELDWFRELGWCPELGWCLELDWGRQLPIFRQRF